jgi:hypothetical protein
MHLTVLMNVWNSALWLPWTLRACYDEVDTIVVTESCWVNGDWVGDTSPDGTAVIVERFMREADPAGKVRFHQAGRVANQPDGRNSGLALIPAETDWVVLVDSDEFYPAGALTEVRTLMTSTRADCLVVPARVFYFDFTWCRYETFQRGWRWFPGQRFVEIAEMQTPNDVRLDLSGIGWQMFHYAYVSPEWTRLKACIGEDVTADRYRRWWESVYSAFDGENLDELYSRNAGGVHVFGGGALERYDGTHPPILDDHPLRHWRWTEPAGRGAGCARGRDATEICGLSFDAAVAQDPRRADVVRRINLHIRNARYGLATRMIERELAGIAAASKVLEHLRGLAVGDRATPG